MSLSLPCPLLSTARAVTMRLFEQGRWTAHRPGQDVRVYYGFDHIHKVVKKHAGGLVKLEDLADGHQLQESGEEQLKCL